MTHEIHGSATSQKKNETQVMRTSQESNETQSANTESNEICNPSEIYVYESH